MSRRGKSRRPSNSAPAIPDPSQRIAETRYQLIAESFSGPLPHPDTLRAYEEIQPGLADRIISMAEKQVDRRISMETYALKSDSRRATAGVIAGLIVFLAFIVSSVYLIDRGRSAEGLIVGLTPTAGMVSAFIYGTVSRRKERKERMETLTGPQPGQQRRR